ncbi:HepT-like ribonuclease domain-containing protein [Burkholderia ambifaria]|uniref:HepT-like ribonuclease domain-containing protein n=1 Tax=Burkholderia ambifaria TaxID=152480 RepID=UPI001B90528B|nr:DUF86 domain-containing protein [Burkholderia ambifaria]
MPTERERCDDILGAGNAILGEVNGHDEKAFIASAGLQAACHYRFVVIGEAANALLNGCPSEVAQCGPDLSTDMTYAKRMRDFLAHQYFAVDPARTWDTIQKDLGRLLNGVAILQALLP